MPPTRSPLRERAEAVSAGWPPTGPVAASSGTPYPGRPTRLLERGEYVFDSLAFMEVNRQTKQRLRQDYQVAVRVRCDRCGRVLGELYGSQEEPRTFSTRLVSGLLPWGARIEYFRCHRRCLSSPYLVRWDKLVVAYRTAAGRPPGQQDLWLLGDVRGR
jgi:hypothetical protein